MSYATSMFILPTGCTSCLIAREKYFPICYHTANGCSLERE
jgi:hypothetical protein